MLLTKLLITILLLALLAILLLSGCEGMMKGKASQEPPTEPDQAQHESWKTMNWVVLAGVLGMALGGALLLYGHKLALPTMVGSIMAMCTAIAISKFYTVFAGVGLAVAIAGMAGVLVLAYLRVRKSFGEVVTVAESAKLSLDDTDESRVFSGIQQIVGSEEKTSVAIRVESPFTKRLVKRERIKQGLIAPKEQ